MRLVIIRLLLFFVPFAVYVAFRLVFPGKPKEAFAPWTLLTIAGLLLVVGSFVWLGLTQGESTAGRYVPPHMVDGKIVPGHVEKTHP